MGLKRGGPLPGRHPLLDLAFSDLAPREGAGRTGREQTKQGHVLPPNPRGAFHEGPGLSPYQGRKRPAWKKDTTHRGVGTDSLGPRRRAVGVAGSYPLPFSQAVGLPPGSGSSGKAGPPAAGGTALQQDAVAEGTAAWARRRTSAHNTGQSAGMAVIKVARKGDARYPRGRVRQASPFVQALTAGRTEPPVRRGDVINLALGMLRA